MSERDERTSPPVDHDAGTEVLMVTGIVAGVVSLCPCPRHVRLFNLQRDACDRRN